MLTGSDLFHLRVSASSWASSTTQSGNCERMGFFETCVQYSLRGLSSYVAFSFLFIIFSDVLTSGTGSHWCGGNDRSPGLCRKSVLGRPSRRLATTLTKLSRLLIVLTLTITGGSLVFRDSQNRWRRKLIAPQTIFLHPFMTW